ncbi:MAG: glycosyltransferase, partial [Muribaculaceae bacterium]
TFNLPLFAKSKPMKVLFINTIAGKTATGNIIDSLASKVISLGMEAYVATGYGKSNVPNVHNIKIGSLIDRCIHATCTRINDSHAMHSVRATNALIDNIIKIKPDVVHLHNLHGYYLHIPLIIEFLKLSNISTIITLHDLWLLTGHCAYPMTSNCNKYTDASCCDCEQKNNYPKSWTDFSARNVAMKKKIFNGFDSLHVVVPSRWMSNIVHGSWFCEHPLFIISNGINTNIFTQKVIEQKDMVLGVANVWTTDKGFNSFIKLRELLPDSIGITMVGVNEHQRKLLPKGITAYKNIDNNQLPELYSCARATINMSQSEAFGVTTIESMACGTPVIAFDNTATHELISHDTGILVRNGDVNSIADAVMKCDKKSYSEACRRQATTLYDNNIMANKYIELYNRLS